MSSRLANRLGLRNTVIWLGVAGIIWIFAGLYALSAALMIPLRDPPELKGAPMPAPAH